MRPHIAAVYAFARIADDMADEGERRGGRSPRRSGRVGPSPRQQPAVAGDAIVASAGRCSRRFARPIDDVPPAGPAAARPPQRVRAGRHGEGLRDVGGFARLLPAIREPGRTAGAAGRRLRSPRSRRGVRRRLHRAAARELLAGSCASIVRRAGSTFRRRCGRPRGARVEDLDAGRMTDAWRAAFADVTARTRALFAKGVPVVDGVARPPALRAARDVAWRNEDSR